MTLHQTRIGINLLSEAFYQLSVHLTHILFRALFLRTDADHRKRAHEHTHRSHERRAGGSSAGYRCIKDLILPADTAHRFSKGGLHIASGGHTALFTEGIDFLCLHPEHYHSLRLSVRMSFSRKHCRFSALHQRIEPLLHFGEAFAFQLLLFIQCIIPCRHSLRHYGFAGKGFPYILEEDHPGDTVKYSVMHIHEQPCILPKGINLQPVQAILHQVKGLNPV